VTSQYRPTKFTWSNADFDQMNWYAVDVHAFALAVPGWETMELLLDVDYITEWTQTDSTESLSGCWVAPATLSFESVSGLEMNLKKPLHNPYSLDAIQRSDEVLPSGNITWVLDFGKEGSIHFYAKRFRMYIRTYPSYTNTEGPNFTKRTKFSFDKVTPESEAF